MSLRAWQDRTQVAHRVTAGGCCENRSGPAMRWSYRRGIVDGSIDVDVRANPLQAFPSHVHAL